MTKAERDALIVARYRDGHSALACAAIVGVNRQTVYSVLRRHGVAMRVHSSALSRESLHERDAALIAHYKAGHSLPACAAKFGLANGSSALVILKRHGIPRRAVREVAPATARKREQALRAVERHRRALEVQERRETRARRARAIVAYYEWTQNQDATGAAFGLTRQRVQQILSAAGIHVNERSA